MATLGNNLKNLRKIKNISQVEFAKKMQIFKLGRIEFRPL